VDKHVPLHLHSPARTQRKMLAIEL